MRDGSIPKNDLVRSVSSAELLEAFICKNQNPLAEPKYEWMDGWMDGLDGPVGGMGGWMDGWVDGWMGGWMDGWVDACMHV